jgi:hypothetical protein
MGVSKEPWQIHREALKCWVAWLGKRGLAFSFVTKQQRDRPSPEFFCSPGNPAKNLSLALQNPPVNLLVDSLIHPP